MCARVPSMSNATRSNKDRAATSTAARSMGGIGHASGPSVSKCVRHSYHSAGYRRFVRGIIAAPQIPHRNDPRMNRWAFGMRPARPLGAYLRPASAMRWAASQVARSMIAGCSPCIHSPRCRNSPSTCRDVKSLRITAGLHFAPFRDGTRSAFKALATPE
jgi:hypothetical protein